MDIKEFRRRLINYYVHPELFLVPVKKKEELFQIRFEFYAQEFDTSTNDFSCEGTYSGYAMIIIINLNNNKKYRFSSMASFKSVLIPSGDYKFKYIAVKGSNGTRVDNVWHYFKITPDGEIEISTSSFGVICYDSKTLRVYLPISVWKFHIYYDENEEVPYVTSENVRGTSSNGYTADQFQVFCEQHFSFKGCLMYDAWLDDEKVASHKPYSNNYYYYHDGLSTLRLRNIYGYAMDHAIHANAKMWPSSQCWVKVPSIPIDIDITLKQICLPYLEQDRYEYPSKCSCISHLKATVVDVTSGFNSLGIKCLSTLLGLNSSFDVGTPIDVENPNISSIGILKILENSFESGFEAEKFDDSKSYTFPIPKKHEVLNMASNGETCKLDGLNSYKYSANSWKALKSIQSQYTVPVSCNFIVSNAWTLITNKNYKYSYINESIDSYYVYTHRVIVGCIMKPESNIYSNVSGRKHLYALNRINGTYDTIENAVQSIYNSGGTYEDVTIETDTYASPASELVFGSETDFRTSTIYSTMEHTGRYSYQSIIKGNKSILNDTPNDAIIYEGAYFGENRTNDYNDWINDPDVTIV